MALDGFLSVTHGVFLGVVFFFKMFRYEYVAYCRDRKQMDVKTDQ